MYSLMAWTWVRWRWSWCSSVLQYVLKQKRKKAQYLILVWIKTVIECYTLSVNRSLYHSSARATSGCSRSCRPKKKKKCGLDRGLKMNWRYQEHSWILIDKSEKEVWKYNLLFTGLLNKIWEFYSGCVIRIKGYIDIYKGFIRHYIRRNKWFSKSGLL